MKLKNENVVFLAQGHGACSFRTAVFCTQPPKTAMSDFEEDSQGGCLSPKRMKFDSPVVESPDQMSTPVGPSPRIEEVAIESDNYGDILDMSTIQEMVMEDGETDVLLMEKSLQISRLPTKANQRRQIEFLRQISASEDATSAGIFLHGCGALIPGWLGRLAFPPSGCLTIPQAKPFFCCKCCSAICLAFFLLRSWTLPMWDSSTAVSFFFSSSLFFGPKFLF